MRIGVVSDTHNHLPNVTRIVELLNAARVDRVVHTGDITQPKTLEVLAGLRAPLVGVFGNNDLERSGLEAAISRHGMDFEEGRRTFAWAGRRVAVIHDPAQVDRSWGSGHHVVLHGHTHRHTCEHRGGTLFFNPGECAGWLQGRNAVGVLELETLVVELIRF
jgi:putative phosphoesterase